MIRRIAVILLALPVAAACWPRRRWRNIIRRRRLITAARRRTGVADEQLPPPRARDGSPTIGDQPLRGAVSGAQKPGRAGSAIGPPKLWPSLDADAASRTPARRCRRRVSADRRTRRRGPPGAAAMRSELSPPGPIGSAPHAAPQPPAAPPGTAALPPEDQPEQGQPKELPANLKRQLVEFGTKEPAGTIIIDTPHTYLYLVLGDGQAIRYGIGVGREGFTWAGTERISKMKEWPDWFPPAEMIERQPYLPRMMAGGEGNPLGARALYLGHTLYRIHGTNQPSTIGQYCVVGLHPPAQRGHRGSVQPRAGRHARRGAAGQAAGDGGQYRRAAGRRRSAARARAASSAASRPAVSSPSKAAPRCRVRRCRQCASASFHFKNS